MIRLFLKNYRPLIEENHSILSSNNSTKGFSRTYMEHLKNKFGWMKEEVPCFGISGRNVHVLNEPIDFYETFKVSPEFFQRQEK